VLATFEGSHPVPDERSLAAGAALLDYAARLTAADYRDDPVLLLVSGGASALAEALRPGVTLAELQTLTRAALADGADIVELNARRRAVSRLKGGELVRALGPHRVQALLVSDVPGDDPAVIGSGLACGTAPDARPAQLQCVARLEDALDAMAAAAAAEGVALRRLPGRFTGDAIAVAQQFLGECGQHDGGLLWGGESTVVLPAQPGRGGRNQQLALAAAMALDSCRSIGSSSPASGNESPAYPAALVLLAAGTDGIDGNSEDAGAVVDATTITLGEIGSGLTAAAALEAADSGTFLEAAGALVHTGRTETNVGDILVAWWPGAPRQGMQ
jgi:hydroxypyruvate reductase